MIKRRIEHKLIKALSRSSSVALLGPRQVGKTTLALSLGESTKAVYLDLENPQDLQKVGDIATFHKMNRDKLIILDEVQRLPEIFQQIRGIIDQERYRGNKTGIFLFLGSASIDLLKQSGESHAGRMETLWLRGGFPESLLADTNANSIAWRHDFIRTYLERDIPQLGPRIPAETLNRFWTMMAHGQGNIINAANLARSLGVSGVTIGRYLDLMVDLLLVRRLQPWVFNVGKRLVKTPKVYVRDSGIVHALLNIPNYNDLLGHPVIGGSWEGFVIENILSGAPDHVRPYYYRTSKGLEVDLLLEVGSLEKWAIEI